MRMKLLNSVVLFGFLCIGVFANDANSNDQSAVSDNVKEDYWQDEYDVNWYSDEVEKLGIVSQEQTDLELKDKEDIDSKINNKEVLIKTPEDQPIATETDNDGENDITFVVSDKSEGKQDYDSYQIEDNRPAMTNYDQNKNIEPAIPKLDVNDKSADKDNDNLQDLVADVNIELNENDLKRIKDLKDREVFRDGVKEVDSDEVEEADTKAVDIETNFMQSDEENDESVNDMNDFSDIIRDPIAEPSQSIQEETKKILEEDISNLNNEPENSDTPTIHSVGDLNIDTAEAIFDDIGDDLKELFSFWDDLDDVDDSTSDEDSESIEDEEEDKTDDTNKTTEQPELEQKSVGEEPNVPSETINNQDKKKQVVSDADLSSSELNDLMTRFAILHFEDIDIQSDNFDKNVAPIHMTLSVDQVIEVTSPNYPDDYPTNNIVDWIFSGVGKGIEFNITDFSVNGYSGDFMLVVPGGIDNAVDNGIVFSYSHNREKHYEFLDVDQLFVRFEAKSGLPSTGFKFSVRLLEHLEEATTTTEEPELPIAEPSVQLDQTLIVYLAGVNPEQFLDKAEKFRLIVADMALEFIARNGLEIGDNNTAEVTQIVSTSSCNVHWPDIESCTSVRFGVPLNGAPGLDERQLRDMWESLVGREPFISRIIDLGIMGSALPNEGSTMTVWLVIGVGVVLSAAMLSFALWRWRCTEDYTRMTSFGESDTDSVIKKSSLDLFPASRHTMPPMYDERYFDASTKVDIGGFANKSYLRHGDFLPIDSDEDTPSADDRLPTAKGGQ